MKEFLSVFIACLFFGGAFTFVFAGFILENFWATFLLIAFLSAVLITVIIKLVIKIEDLEEKVERLLNNKQDRES